MQVIETEQHNPAFGNRGLDIQEEIRIFRKQPVAFIANQELGELYTAMQQRWQRPGEQGCGAFMASLFYSMGRIHGIREERARRKSASGGFKSQIIWMLDHADERKIRSIYFFVRGMMRYDSSSGANDCQ